MKTYLFTFAYILMILFNINAQNLNNIDTCNCPPQYTHSEDIKTKIEIGKIVVLDSAKYSVLPNTKDNLDSLVNLITYPEPAWRAKIFGEVKNILKIDNNGKVKKINIVKGMGAGLDEASTDILKTLNFNPAKIQGIPVESEVVISVYYTLNVFIDKPEYVLDEIKYESFGRTEYFKNTIIFEKDGTAHYIHNYPDDFEESIGKINIYIYSKLSNFILSQCFINLKDTYKGRTTDSGTQIITVKYKDVTKSVLSTGGEFYPISFWATVNLITHLKNGIKWEIIKKSESTIKQLPKK